MLSNYRFLALLLCIGLLTTAFAAPPAGKRLTLVIRNARPEPQNLEVNDRKTDTVFLQNADSVTYKIVWTDKNYGSPFVAPNTPKDKSTITLEPFGTPRGPFKVHDAVKAGQRYSFDVIAVRAGKESRAGGGSVVVQ